MQRNELTCREFVGLIRRLRDDELSDVDRRSFLQHRGEVRPMLGLSERI